MLSQSTPAINIAVRDLATARRFYAETLGLSVVAEPGGHLIVFRAGNTNLYVYNSEFAGTNKATALTWPVGAELPTIVAALKSKGVSFEHYTLPGLTLQGDIHTGNGPDGSPNFQIVWFRDPDGNILSLTNAS